MNLFRRSPVFLAQLVKGNVSFCHHLAIFIEDLPLMLPIKIRLIWQSDFKGEDFSQIGQSETRIACSGHVCKWIGTK
jgi:hypothetical protein